MCGRLNVTGDSVVQWICDYLGISFEVTENTDLRPSQMVASITGNGEMKEEQGNKNMPLPMRREFLS
jgi:hypothetical protein